MTPAFRYGCTQADRAMQFLVYLTVLMVSISTVLLEVHWLTSPEPQSKPAIQTTNASPPAPKTEGPSAALSPVYPKKTDTPPPAVSASQAPPSAAIPQPAPVQQPAAAATVPAQQAAAEPTATAAPPPQRPETTGVAAREHDVRQQAASATNVSNRAAQETAAVPSGNHCDVQACSSAYKSFRAADCTYQPFEGARRFCERPPVQRTAREQREEPERRKWSSDVYPRDVDRSTIGRRIDDDDDEDAADFDDDSERIVIRRLGPRW